MAYYEEQVATSLEVIIVPMDGHANQWGASQPFDLLRKPKMTLFGFRE